MPQLSIWIIVQARTASHRLPAKVLLPILGKPMIIRQLERIQHVSRTKNLVVATSKLKSDDCLVQILEKEGYKVFRGSNQDVLDRIYRAATKYGATDVVRLTADCPLIEPNVIDLVVESHVESQAEYTTNTYPPTYPDGLDVEVISYPTLTKIWDLAEKPSEREHVTLYIKNNNLDFNIKNVVSDIDFSRLRWTVDEERDFKFVDAVYSALFHDNCNFSMGDILSLLEKYPELIEINSGIMRDEGLRTSLEREQ